VRPGPGDAGETVPWDAATVSAVPEGRRLLRRHCRPGREWSGRPCGRVERRAIRSWACAVNV